MNWVRLPAMRVTIKEASKRVGTALGPWEKRVRFKVIVCSEKGGKGTQRRIVGLIHRVKD